MKIKFSVHPKNHPGIEKMKQKRAEMKSLSNAQERKALRKIRSFNKSHSGSF